MDKQKGWVKVYRCIEDNWLWDETPFSYGQAWIDMLMMANHSQKKTLFNKEPVTIERGSFITSIRKLSARWGWSKDKVLRFMRTLEKDEMITRESDNQRTLVSLVKYGFYQDERDTNEDTDKDADEDTNATRNGHQQGHERDTNAPQTRIKNDKNEKNEKKDIVGKAPTPSPHQIIIEYLNEKTGSSYRTTNKATQRAINGRLSEGFTVENFKAVIDVKVKKWLNDPKMRDYLRPETLFAASHFESYLNEAIAEKPQKPQKQQKQHSALSERLMNETTAEETETNINNHSSDDHPFN